MDWNWLYLPLGMIVTWFLKPAVSRLLSPIFATVTQAIGATPLEASQAAIYREWISLAQPYTPAKLPHDSPRYDKHETRPRFNLIQRQSIMIEPSIIYKASGESESEENLSYKELQTLQMISRESSGSGYGQYKIKIRAKLLETFIKRSAFRRVHGVYLFFRNRNRLRNIEGELSIHNLQQLLKLDVHSLICLLVFLEFMGLGKFKMESNDFPAFQFTPEKQNRHAARRGIEYFRKQP